MVKTRVMRSRVNQIVKNAENIYNEQRNVDTPPADMEDVTKVIRMMALEIYRLATKVKELEKNGE